MKDKYRTDVLVVKLRQLESMLATKAVTKYMDFCFRSPVPFCHGGAKLGKEFGHKRGYVFWSVPL